MFLAPWWRAHKNLVPKVSKGTVNYVELRKISSKHLRIYIYTKPCVEDKHLSRKTLKMACFQLWDGEETRKKIYLN